MHPHFARWFFRSSLTLLFAVAIPLRSHAAGTAMQLAQAMDIPTNAIVSASFTHLAGAEAANAPLDWGTTLPLVGTNFAVISTGKAVDPGSTGWVVPQPGTSFSATGMTNTFAGQPGCPEPSSLFDLTELTVVLNVPTNAVGFAVQFRFYSAEYPEDVCSLYNDRFAILLTSQNFTGNVALDGTNFISVNSVHFTLTNATQLAGTGMDGSQSGNQLTGAGTDWLTASKAVKPGETITLKFLIFDGMDATTDSMAVIDNFHWLSPVKPVINRAVAIRWPSDSNLLYQVQSAPALATNNWTNFGSSVRGNGTTNLLYDDAENASRFYRIMVSP